MNVYDKLVPDGYEVEETDERFPASYIRRFYTKSAAITFTQRFPPMTPSWRYVVEKRGWFHYETVPYQNRLRKIDP